MQVLRNCLSLIAASKSSNCFLFPNSLQPCFPSALRLIQFVFLGDLIMQFCRCTRSRYKVRELRWSKVLSRRLFGCRTNWQTSRFPHSLTRVNARSLAANIAFLLSIRVSLKRVCTYVRDSLPPRVHLSGSCIRRKYAVNTLLRTLGNYYFVICTAKIILYTGFKKC